MKYLLVFLLSAAIFISCNNKKPVGYAITGDIRNLDSGWVYLQVMRTDSLEHTHWPIIDSARYKNGKFVLHADSILKEPLWGASLLYKADNSAKREGLLFFNSFNNNSRYGSFVLENGGMTVTGDMADEKGLIINGSPETAFSYQYGVMSPPFRTFGKLYTLADEIDSLQKASDGDGPLLSRQNDLQNSATRSDEKNDTEISGLINRYYKLRDSMLVPYKRYFKRIIHQNPASYCALFNIYNNAMSFSPDELEKMYLSMNRSIRECPTGKKLAVYITHAMKLQPGKPFPDFNYQDTAARTFNLSAVRGQKATLMVFWASWCGPCRKEIPELKHLYLHYHKRGLSIVNISIDDNANWWKKAVGREKMPWLNLGDPANYEAIAVAYNLHAIPAMFLLDSQGNILLKSLGDYFLVKEKVSKLLGE